MFESQSTVATEKPAPYMKQLCKHFGHKVEASFDDERGSIDFPELGKVVLDASLPGVLKLTAASEQREGLARLEEVVGSHLVRFGKRDELVVEWAPRTRQDPSGQDPAAA